MYIPTYTWKYYNIYAIRYIMRFIFIQNNFLIYQNNKDINIKLYPIRNHIINPILKSVQIPIINPIRNHIINPILKSVQIPIINPIRNHITNPILKSVQIHIINPIQNKILISLYEIIKNYGIMKINISMRNILLTTFYEYLQFYLNRHWIYKTNQMHY